jgi:hypothetical protein
VVRRWLAIRQQRRRRCGASSDGGVPPAVVLNPGEPFWCPTDPGWVSVRLSWSYAAGGFAGGTFEIGKCVGGDGNFVAIGSLALTEMVGNSGGLSSYQFVESYGTNMPALLWYRVRCVCGGVQGAWSAVCEVNIDNRNWAFP